MTASTAKKVSVLSEPDIEALTSVCVFHLSTRTPAASAVAQTKALKPLPNICED